MTDSSAAEPLLGPNPPMQDDCVEGAWSRRPPAETTPEATADDIQVDVKSLIWSFATMALSLPALVGSWCWPLLVAGLLGVAATGAAKALAHSISLAVMLAVVSNLLQYSCWRALEQSGASWRRRWGPPIMLALAIPLVSADPLRHVLQDSGVWTGQSSRMYRPGCGPVSGLHGILCLSVTGAIFQACTYAGFILLLSGVFWQTDLIPKLRAGWNDIRRARKATAASRRNQTSGVADAV